MHDIIHFVRFHVPPERVYRAIGTTDYLRQWWIREGQPSARAGETTFDAVCRSIEARVRFDDRRPPVSVRWRTIPVSSAIAGWEATTIKFDLRASDSGTLLSLTHDGFEEADDDYDRTATGWASCLLCLQRHLEAGNGFGCASWETNTFLAAANPSRPLTLAIER
jgi:uncharacterized protein YndB with AHSA1/START domain